MASQVQCSTTIDGNGRVAKMVRWLIDNQERVGRPEKVQVTFDCAGRSVIAELKEREKIEPHQ